MIYKRIRKTVLIPVRLLMIPIAILVDFGMNDTWDKFKNALKEDLNIFE